MLAVYEGLHGNTNPPSHGSHQALELRGLAGEQVGVDAQSGENGLVAGTEHSLLWTNTDYIVMLQQMSQVKSTVSQGLDHY